MRGNTVKISLFVCLILVVARLGAQGSRCSEIQPFCAGNGEFVFPNSNRSVSNVVVGESGPDYGCLEFPRYPSWFYLQIENAGDLEFLIAQSENQDGSGEALDVDFVVWGPFNASDDFCSDQSLSEEHHVDCSYSDKAKEIATINNAQKGEIYVFLITNYSELEGYINLQQTNSDSGAGSTDCSFLDGVLGGDKSICGENETTLNAENQGASTYQWFVLNETSDNFVRILDENEAQLTVSVDGTYKVVVENGDADVITEDIVEVTFYEKPLIVQPIEAIPVCVQDGLVDLSIQEPGLLSQNDSQNANFDIEFFETKEDILNERKIEDPTAYMVDSDISVFARITNTLSGCTSEIVEIIFDFRSYPQMVLENRYQVCVDPSGLFENELILGKDLGKAYRYSWYHGDQLVSSEYDLFLFEESADPNYTLVLTEEFTNCEFRFTTTLEYRSGPGSLKVEVLKGDFENNWDIEVFADAIVGHASEYEYSLDDGDYTSSSILHNVPPGNHSVSVREVGGCGRVAQEEITVIGYDSFFTPNDDGYNDYWKVIQNADYKVLRIRVYDRNGVFLKEIDPDGQGWDGTVNGKVLPEDDYWFNLEYVNFRSSSRHNFSSHFSLMK